MLENKLRSLIQLPYTVVAQHWGIRPATFDRRPFIGIHHSHPSLIFLMDSVARACPWCLILPIALQPYLLDEVSLPSEVRIDRISFFSPS